MIQKTNGKGNGKLLGEPEPEQLPPAIVQRQRRARRWEGTWKAERSAAKRRLNAIVRSLPTDQQARFKKLSTEAQRHWGYRRLPSLWALDHLDVRMARYRAQDELEAWLDTQPPDSHCWCREQLAAGKLTLDPERSYQAEFLDGMAEPGWYALRCANGIAKTATAAMFVHWFLDVYPPDGPGGTRVVTTAGSWGQVKEQLWREIHVWEAQAAAGPDGHHMVTRGQLNQTQINLAANWAAISRAADKAETFEGVHGDNVAIIVDEAKAVRGSVYNAFRRIMRGSQEGRYWYVFLSSPGSPSGPFWEMTDGAMSHRVKTFGLSAYESSRISLDTVAQDAEDLGEGSPLFVSMNLGQHPEEGEDVVILLSWVLAAEDREVDEGPHRVLGIDVARRGRHETALVSLTGRRARLEATYQGRDLVWTAGEVLRRHQVQPYHAIAWDDTGLGGGLGDQLMHSPELKGVLLIPVNFGATADHPERYVNLKTEIEFMCRAEMEAGFADPGNRLVGLSIPDDKKLKSQLASERFDYDNKQRYLIASSRGVDTDDLVSLERSPSPDRAHGLFLANYARAKMGLAERAGRIDRRVRDLNLEDAHVRGLGASVLREDF